MEGGRSWRILSVIGSPMQRYPHVGHWHIPDLPQVASDVRLRAATGQVDSRSSTSA